MKIALLATGGTVAMTSIDGAGATPTVGAQYLADTAAWPSTTSVMPRQVLQKPSASLTLQDIQTLVWAVEAAIVEGCEGVVITHGTDTLEETAFALCVMLKTEIPVILTGAMRTPDQPGADGPANIAAAIAVAASSEARGCGPLVVFGDDIHAGALVRKHHTQRPAAFSSAPFGPLGLVAEGRACLVLRPQPFPLAPQRVGDTILAAPILQVGLDLEPETLAAFHGAPICGLVLAGAGGGHVSGRSVQAIATLGARVPVVLASRTGGGPVLSRTYGYAGGEIDLIGRGTISAGWLSPVQARILLQILTSTGQDVRAAFAPFAAD